MHTLTLLPHFGSLQAGFPSPADDYTENSLDLHQYLIKNKPSTFFVRVESQALTQSHICRGDLLVVDTSLSPKHGSIVVACYDGELLVRHFLKINGKNVLSTDDAEIPPLELYETEFSVFGIVTGVIRKI